MKNGQSTTLAWRIVLYLACFCGLGLLSSASLPAQAAVGLWTTRGPQGVQINTVAVANTTNGSTIYAGANGAYVSTLNDRSWTAMNCGLASQPAIQALALGSSGSNGRILFAATTTGVARYTSSGSCWSPYTNGLPTGVTPLSLALQPNYDDGVTGRRTLFLGTRDGVYRSTNGGNLWAAVGLAGVQVSALAVSPNFSIDHALVAGATDGKVYISTDGGTTWSPQTAGCQNGAVEGLAYSPDALHDNTLFISTADGLYKRDAQSCRRVLTSESRSVTFGPAYPTQGKLYAATVNGVYASPNKGETWKAMSDGLGNANVHAIGMAVEGDVTTLLAGTDAGVWEYVIPGPAKVATLILTHRERLRHFYGDAAEADLQSHLARLASYPDAYGMVIDLSDAAAYPAVAAAYADWTTHPTTVKANAVATAIRTVVAGQMRTFINLKYLVIVGGDQIIPFFRTPDLTRTPEGRYRGSVTDLAPSGTITSTVLTALDDNQTLTDDYYAGYADAPPYVSRLAVGRLVETPADMSAFIDAFLDNGGDRIITSKVALVTSDSDYLSDGASRVAASIQDMGLDPTALSGSWNFEQFRASLLGRRNDLVSINQHGYHDRLMLPTGLQSDVTSLTAHDVMSGTTGVDLGHGLVIAIACHAGLNIPDANGHNALDLPQAFAHQRVNFIANTGFGWATSDTIGLSELLENQFFLILDEQLHTANGTAVLGQVLRDAKARYFLTSRTFSAYDAKVMNELTLYGLPMAKLTAPPSTQAAQSAQPAQPTVPDAAQIKRIYYTNKGPHPADADVIETPDMPEGLTELVIDVPAPGLITHTVELGARSGDRPMSGRTGTFFEARTMGNGRMEETLDGAKLAGPAGRMEEIGEGVQPSPDLPLVPKFFIPLGGSTGSVKGTTMRQAEYRIVTTASDVPTDARTDLPSPAPSHTRPVTGWYPAIPQVVNQVEAGDDQDKAMLAFAVGQVAENPDGGVTYRLNDYGKRVSFRVFSSTNPNKTPPSITSVSHVVDSHVVDKIDVAVTATVTDTTTLYKVIATWTDGQGQWQETNLTQGDGGQWQAKLPLPSAPNVLEYYIQAVNAAGNVAVDDNNGQYYRAAAYGIFLPLLIQGETVHMPGPTPTPTATASATSSTPSPTPSLTPTPTATPTTAVGALTGWVTLSGTPVPDLPLELSLLGGDDEPVVASTRTDAQGRYTFDNVPLPEAIQLPTPIPLFPWETPTPPGPASYAVDYRNPFALAGRLAKWRAAPVYHLSQGAAVAGGDFDIADVPLGEPGPTPPVRSLPVTFRWTPRSGTPGEAGESYRFHLIDPSVSSREFTSPDLGHVGQYTLTTLPDGWDSGTTFAWTVDVTTPAGAGQARDRYPVRFPTPTVTPTAGP